MKNVIKAVIAVVVLAGTASAETKWNVDVFQGEHSKGSLVSTTYSPTPEEIEAFRALVNKSSGGQCLVNIDLHPEYTEINTGGALVLKVTKQGKTLMTVLEAPRYRIDQVALGQTITDFRKNSVWSWSVAFPSLLGQIKYDVAIGIWGGDLGYVMINKTTYGMPLGPKVEIIECR